MEVFLIKVAQLIAALALLVVVHEFGHYIFARIFGIRVEKFYLFFNPWFSICKWKPKPPKKVKLNKDGTPRTSWRDTEYGIGWIPLGGYCKIAGMIDESMDKEQMAQPAKPDEFRSRPAYQRLLVMTGGVIFNFILAIIIYIGIALAWGTDYIPYKDMNYGFNYSETAKNAGYQDGDVIIAADDNDNLLYPKNTLDILEAKEVTVRRNDKSVVISNPENFPLEIQDDGFFNKEMPFRYPAVVKSVRDDSPAFVAGLMADDQIVKVDGKDTPSFIEIKNELGLHKSQPVTVTVLRDGKELTYDVTPDKDGLIGVEFNAVTHPSDIYDLTHVDYGFFEAIPQGIGNGADRLVSYVGSLKYLFTSKGAQQIGGFGAIGNLFPAKWDWRTFWEMAAFLSVILAFMNILPIPALDGGHVMFLLWEIITRRKPSDKFLERAQIIGMLFLLLLLVYANGNDIYRMLIK